MVDGSGDPAPVRRRFELYEVALLTLGVATSLTLLVFSKTRPVLLEVVAGTIIYWTALYICRIRESDQRVSFIASFLFVSWFYWCVSHITPALGTRNCDKALLVLDQAIFGHTPSIYFERAATSWLTDLMSICYMTYHLYLAIIVIHVLRDPTFANRHLRANLFMGFALGFTGYLLVPAVGPARAYPELFRTQLPGGIISKVIAEIVARGSSIYDTFPSLHVMITCLLLDHDWRDVRRRFWLMVTPALGLVASTIYLRYHYGVDILAGILGFLVLRQTILKTEPASAGLPA